PCTASNAPSSTRSRSGTRSEAPVVSTEGRRPERRDLLSAISGLSSREGLSARPSGPWSRRRCRMPSATAIANRNRLQYDCRDTSARKDPSSMHQFVAVAVICTALAPALAWAGANCKANPKAEWMSEADAKAKIEAQGYKISKFKIDGNCYEIYGTDKN